MVNEQECSLKKKHLSESYVGELGSFSKGVLWVIEDNRELARIAQNQDEGKVSKEEIIQAVQENEVIASTDTSCEYERME